jgi:o-succinylbenzoate synthase
LKIINIKTQIVKAPLKKPFKTALRRVDSLEDLVLLIYTDSNLIGYGEGASTAVITGETLSSMQGAIEHIKPLLIGKDIEDFNTLLYIIKNSMVHNNTIKSALEMALYDLRSQSLKLPLFKFLGGSKTKFKTDITISLNSIDTMLQDCQDAIDLGYDILKIKVGESILEDYSRIEILAKTYPDVTLRIDANQAWSAKETVKMLQRLERKNIFPELIEQPVKRDDIRGMKYIRERTLTPLLADESIFDTKEAIEFLEMEACDFINIKLAKCGGISEALKIADIAEIYGVKCMMGCMLEGAISITAGVHLASAKSNIITMLDLDSVNLLAYNPINVGTQFNGSEIILGDDYGLGSEIPNR